MYFFCRGNYAHLLIERANAVQTMGRVEHTPSLTFGLKPGNTCHSLLVSGLNNLQKQDALATLGNLAGILGNYGVPNNPQESGLAGTQCVVNTTTFGEWKRTLTNFLLSQDGFCGINCSTNSSPILSNTSGVSYLRTLYNTNNTPYLRLYNSDTSLYQTERLDDYLIVTNVYYYDDSGQALPNTCFSAIRGIASPYKQFISNQWQYTYYNDYNIYLNPDKVILGNYNKNRHSLLNDTAALYANAQGGTYYSTSLYSNIAPYEAIYLLSNRSLPANSFEFDTTVSGGDKAYYSPCFCVYAFKDFTAIQKWYIDFGIKAYRTQNELDNGDFPDDLEEDLGFEDNENPEDIDYLPDNKGDPLDMTDPDLTPESCYDLYALNYSNYQGLKGNILSTDFWNSIVKFFTNPLESILSITLFPFDFYNHNTASLNATNSIDIINYKIENISCYKFLPKYPFFNFNLGSLELRAYYGNYLDYQAEYKLYIPFCGTLSLDPSLVINQEIYLRASISALTGAGTVYVTNGEDRLLGTLSGNFGNTLSFNSNNFAQTLTNAIMNNIPKSVADLTSPTALITTPLNFGKDLLLSPQHNSLTGTIGGNAAFGGVTTPFIQVTLPIPTAPSEYKSFNGINSQYSVQIKSLPQEHFVSFEEIRINVPCTEEERSMIDSLLRSGIII